MPTSLLAALGGLGTDQAVLETSVTLARNGGGHVSCLHVHHDSFDMLALADAVLPGLNMDSLRQVSGEQAERARHARRAFEVIVEEHGLPVRDSPEAGGEVTTNWIEAVSRVPLVLQEARFHELTVMGRESAWSRQAMVSILMESGRPVLLAPPMPLPTVGRRIAIAWKEGPAAARAVAAASYWLRQAESVLILCASRNRAGDDSDRVSAQRLADAMAWQGIHAKIQIEHGQGSEGSSLRTMAYDCNADMLVMGAYGHSRLRESILGGVTAQMLDNCIIPIFLAH